MRSFNILIVEDEILIADTIKRYLLKQGHNVAGIAINFDEAKDLYLETKPDLALLDIRLSGNKSGIDVAEFLHQQNQKIPSIFLTSQIDRINLEAAKKTMPAGYLSKPLQIDSLLSTIEIVMHNHVMTKPAASQTITLNNGSKNHLIEVKDILYLKADHIYVWVHLVGAQQIMLRSSLKELLDQLPQEKFIQTHRSFAINIEQVSQWESDQIQVKDDFIPVSRSRRKLVLEYLNLN